MSDFDETLYMKFLGNLILYFGGLNPTGKFPHYLGEKKIFKILDCDEIKKARSNGNIVVLFLGYTPQGRKFRHWEGNFF